MHSFTRRPSEDYAAAITIEAPMSAVRDAVATVEGVRGWWTDRTEGSAEPGGEFRVVFRPEYTKTIRVGEPGRPAAVSWHCVDNQPEEEWIGTTMTFELAEATPGTTELRFTHHGLQPRLECYESCEAAWDYVLRSLASYAETGTGQPYTS